MSDATRPDRRRGDGSTYQTKDGRWRAVLTEPDSRTGQPRRRYLSAATEDGIRAALDAARRIRDDDRPISTPTLAAYLADWLERAAIARRATTIELYRSTIRRLIVPELGRRRLDELRPIHIEAALTAWKRSGLAPRTVLGARAVLSAALSDAERDGLVRQNVARLTRPERPEPRERRALSPADLRAIITAAERDRLTGGVVILAASVGLRRGELLGLRWTDLDAPSGTLSVRRSVVTVGPGDTRVGPPKSSRSHRTIALPVAARRALERELAWATEAIGRPPELDALIFGDPLRGGPRTPSSVGHAAAGLLRRAGYPGRGLHDLRHAVASAALAAGVPPRDVAEALGHSTSVLLATYAHALPGSRERVRDALDAALAAS